MTIEERAKELYIIATGTYSYSERTKWNMCSNWDKANHKTKTRYRKLARHVEGMIAEARIEELKNTEFASHEEICKRIAQLEAGKD